MTEEGWTVPTATVNATRMELMRLKHRLRTALRGHKLLRDKRDELMRRFLELIRENRALRTRVEEGLMRAYRSFTVAAALMSAEGLEQALLYPCRSTALEVGRANIMGVETPVYRFQTRAGVEGERYPYGFAATSGELDGAVDALTAVFPDLLRLAQMEKTTQMLAGEIENTRRRVNALEHVMIPDLEENIRVISLKLEENERGGAVRLMKVKDRMLAESAAGRRRETAEALGFLS